MSSGTTPWAGWPLTDHVNAFSMSLIIYPIIVTRLLLYRAGRVGPGFWALVSGGGAVFVSAVHFGPAAVEPPEMIHDAYASPDENQRARRHFRSTTRDPGG
jgi:hypothetical protein